MHVVLLVSGSLVGENKISNNFLNALLIINQNNIWMLDNIQHTQSSNSSRPSWMQCRSHKKTEYTVEARGIQSFLKKSGKYNPHWIHNFYNPGIQTMTSR